MSSGRGQAVTLKGGTASGGSILILLPGFIGPVANDLASGWLYMDRDITTAGAVVHITAKTAPGATDVHYRLEKSSNNGTSFAAIHSGSLTLPHGDHVATVTPTWTDDLAEGELLRIDLTQTDNGTGADVSIVVVPA